MPDHDEFARDFAAAEPEVGEAVAVAGLPGELGEQRNPEAGSDELLQRRDLRAAIADARLEFVIAEEGADLPSEGTGVAQGNEGLVR